MGFFSRKLEARSSMSSPPEWLIKWFGGGKTASGATVSNYTALNYNALWACVRVICKPVATMPLHLYERLDGGGKQRATGHPNYNLLHSRPNSEMTALTFKDTLTAHVLTWGNGYAEIEFNRAGRPVALWPLTPNRVTPERNLVTKELEYKVNLFGINGPQKDDYVTLKPQQVFHIPGPGFDGIKGYSVLTMFRESIGLGLSMQEYAARFFGNGAMPAGVLEHPGAIKDPGKDYLRNSWNEMHQGLSKTHRIAILEEGMKYHQIGISPEDAQMLDSRKFGQLEMASIFQIPPHKVTHMEDATFSNVEQENQSFLSDTLLYWLVLWEQTYNWKLLTPAEQKKYFAEFLTAHMLRGDIASRYAAYAIGRQWGWLSPDDVRDMENMNPLPGDQGKIYIVPLNMVPANMVGQETGQGEQPVKPESSRSSARFMEIRADTIAKGRRTLANAFKSVFRDAGARIVKREVNDLRRAIKDHLGKRDVQDFQNWLTKYYEKHPEFIERQMLPVLLSYAEAVQGNVADEIGIEAGMTPELERYIREDYMSAFYLRYILSSQGQLEALVRDTVAAEEDPVPVLEQRLTEWDEKRPDKISLKEVVKAAGAVSLFVYGRSGFVKKRWHAHGQSCPFCQQLNGKIVGIEQDFTGGNGVEDKQGQKLIPKGRILHAPLHLGCDCVVLAER